MVKHRNEPARNGTAHDDELTPAQEAAAVEVARGASYAEAAKETGSGLTTIKVWASTIPAFKARVRELRAELTARVMGRMADAMCAAITTLEKLCDKKNSALVRQKAAETLLDKGITLTQAVAFEERLAALERQGARR